MERFSKIRKYLFIAFIVVLITGIIASIFWSDELPWEEMREYVASSRFAPVIFILIYTALSIFIPTTPLMAIAGALFGFLNGFIYTTIAGFISATGIFFTSRHLGKNFVEETIGQERIEKFHAYYDKNRKHKMLAVIILRILPIMPFNILSLALGVTRISFLEYIVGSILGLLPSHALTVYFGAFAFTNW